MKTTILTIALLFASQFLQAQTHFAAYMESTTMGHKSGFMSGHMYKLVYPYQHKTYDAVIGGFYQREVISPVAKSEQSGMIDHEISLVGAYAELMFNNDRKFSTAFNIRTGLQNGQNFVITPMIKAAYKLAPNTKVEIGVSSRNVLSPTISYGIAFQL